MKPNAKPKKPRSSKKKASELPDINPFDELPDDIPALFPPDEECTIIMTDKKSIMS